MRKQLNIDKVFLGTVFAFLLIGFFILASASMGLLARTAGADFSSIIFQQIIYGLVGCIGLYLFAFKFDYKILRRFAFPLLIFGLVASSLVFLPKIGFSHGGASRWISVGPFFFQPSEFLKLGLIVYAAAWISSKRRNIADFKTGFLPFAGILTAAGFLLVLQRDMGTLGVAIISCAALFFLGGGKFKHLLAGLAIIGIVFASLIYFEPYRMKRVTVFLNPSYDPQGAGYQLRQSLIAIGAGGMMGKGFGMSAQKFTYLPEPVSDSIFAVFAEEFGFAGGLFLLCLFLFFLYKGFSISIRAPDDFGRLLGAGIVILIVMQSFINVAAMLGIFPLTGIPLVFVSKGGSSLIATLVEAGILLNISKYRRT
ncbi:MAG: Stage V sporulation protein E [Parcubacteria group bacterium GW2011_GWB1_43_8]|nr:MAG: Stage V sporulation protein E [Parcubacteria group bacterium GW2011_GWB1_43_8]